MLAFHNPHQPLRMRASWQQVGRKEMARQKRVQAGLACRSEVYRIEAVQSSLDHLKCTRRMSHNAKNRIPDPIDPGHQLHAADCLRRPGCGPGVRASSTASTVGMRRVYPGCANSPSCGMRRRRQGPIAVASTHRRTSGTPPGPAMPR